MATTTERGYGWQHQKAKAALAPHVHAYGAVCAERICLERTRVIPPGTKSSDWDLAHDRRNPGHYLGPAHPRCNRAEGARYRAWLRLHGRRLATRTKPPRWSL